MILEETKHRLHLRLWAGDYEEDAQLALASIGLIAHRSIEECHNPSCCQRLFINYCISPVCSSGHVEQVEIFPQSTFQRPFKRCRASAITIITV